MDARTEEIRAEWREAAKGIAEDAHCRYCDFQNQDSRLKCKRDVEFAVKEIVELVDSETAALREDVERLKGALGLIQLNSSCDCDEEFCAKHKAIEALSPSPAQQEGPR